MFLGPVAYSFALPSNRSSVHPIFLESMLKMYYCNVDRVINYDSIVLYKTSYKKELFVILDRDVFKLRTKNICSVKV